MKNYTPIFKEYTYNESTSGTIASSQFPVTPETVNKKVEIDKKKKKDMEKKED